MFTQVECTTENKSTTEMLPCDCHQRFEMNSNAIQMDFSRWNCFQISTLVSRRAINVSDSFFACASRISQFNISGPLTLNRFDRPVPFNQFPKTTFWCRERQKKIVAKLVVCRKTWQFSTRRRWWWPDKKSIWIKVSAEFLCPTVHYTYSCSGDMDRNEFRTMWSLDRAPRDRYEWWINKLVHKWPCRNWNWLRLNSYSNAFNMYDFQHSAHRRAAHQFMLPFNSSFLSIWNLSSGEGPGDVGKVNWAVWHIRIATN